MTARAKARLSKSMHSGNAYVTTNGAENRTAPHTPLYSLLVYEICSHTHTHTRMHTRVKNKACVVERK